jgi:serine/threonine protein kinase
MAPELTGEHALQGPGVDIYSLGAILYRALVGKPPFEARTFAGLVKMLLFDRPVPPSEVVPDAPPELEAITLKCLEKDPKNRYATGAELAAALEHFVSGGEEPAPALEDFPATDASPPAPKEPEEDDEALESEVLHLGSRSPKTGTRRASASSARMRRPRFDKDSEKEREKQVLQKVLMVLIPIGLLAFLGLAFALSR